MKDQARIDATGIVSENVLMQITGYKRRKDLMDCLNGLKIPYFLGKKGQIWTTLSAMNSCLVDVHTKQQRALH